MTGERFVRIGNKVFYMVDVPDDVTDKQLLESLKLGMMLEDKIRVNGIIERNGIVAS